MIVVTGGAGFIGSNLVKGLNDEGEDDILIVDNLFNASKHLNLNCLHYSDFIDKKKFIEDLPSLRKPRAIFHQGACSVTTESDGRYMMDNNYEFSKLLLQYCLELRVPFLYASSAAVYGNGLRGFREERITEYPLNIYGFSKFCFDNYVRMQLPKASSQVLGLRYFNVYGPQENHKGSMASVAFHLFQELKEDNSMSLFEGSEEFCRDFIHVKDTIKINLYFLKSGVSGIYNAGTGKSHSFLELAESFSGIHGSGTIKFIPFPEVLRGKYQVFTEADTRMLRKAGYMENFLPLEEGIHLFYTQLKESGGYHI